jgi:MFS family permease
MGAAFNADLIQDDARQHVFWMQRLVDPGLLQGDLFADYFASQAPPGYVLIFRLLLPFTNLVTASKLLPPVLGLSATLFTFLLVARLYPSPPAAFLASILGSWYVWQYDDLATGSPRAFLLPLIALLLYALAAGWRWWLVALVGGIAATLYPSAAALAVVLVGAQLIRMDGWRPVLDRRRPAWLAAIASGLLTALILAPTVLGGSPFGPAIDGQTARQLPEFGPSGRNAFFNSDPYQFWVVSYRSGFDLRVTDRVLTGVPILYGLLALSLLLPPAALLRRPDGAPCLSAVSGCILRLFAASALLFLAAHLLLFKLYLPARFVAWSVPLALAIAAGVGLVALVTRTTLPMFRPLAPWLAGVAALLVAAGLVAYPAAYDGNFVPDRTPEITEYLRQLPPDAVILGAPVETDSVPAFTGRRVLTNREYALAYHPGYYAQVEERTRAAIDAYYAETPEQLLEISRRYGVTVYLVNRNAFDPTTAADAWAGSFAPYTSLVIERLEGGRQFVLLDAARRCGALTDGDVTVVPAACVTASR